MCRGKGVDARVPSVGEEEEGAWATTGTGNDGIPWRCCERGQGVGDGGSGEAELCVAILRVTTNLLSDLVVGYVPAPPLRVAQGKQPQQGGVVLWHGALESSYLEQIGVAWDVATAGQHSGEGQAGAGI